VDTLLGLIVFVILVVGGLLGLQAGGQVPQAVIILLSAGVGFAVWRAQKNAEQTQELEAKLGSDKKVLYKLYLDIMREVVEKGGKADTKTYVGRLRRWVFATLLIASDDVVLAMRRDAGEETSLQPIDILATLITADDIDKMRPICDQWARDKANAWRLAAARVSGATTRR
jgi:hypothetical protein